MRIAFILALLWSAGALAQDSVIKNCKSDGDCPLRSTCQVVNATTKEQRCVTFCRSDANCGPGEECRRMRECDNLDTCPKKCYKRMNMRAAAVPSCFYPPRAPGWRRYL